MIRDASRNLHVNEVLERTVPQFEAEVGVRKRSGDTEPCGAVDVCLRRRAGDASRVPVVLCLFIIAFVPPIELTKRMAVPTLFFFAVFFTVRLFSLCDWKGWFIP